LISRNNKLAIGHSPQPIGPKIQSCKALKTHLELDISSGPPQLLTSPQLH